MSGPESIVYHCSTCSRRCTSFTKEAVCPACYEAVVRERDQALIEVANRAHTEQELMSERDTSIARANMAEGLYQQIARGQELLVINKLRTHVQTAETMSAAWRKRAEEAEQRENELRALLDEAQRDAERYRWLRDVWWLGDDYFDTPDPMAHANSADEFDAAIDEARIPRASVVEHHAPHCDLNKPSSFVKCTCGYERIPRAGG